MSTNILHVCKLKAHLKTLLENVEKDDKGFPSLSFNALHQVGCRFLILAHSKFKSNRLLVYTSSS